MATLVAIGYPDEISATAASQEAQRLAKDPIFSPTRSPPSPVTGTSALFLVIEHATPDKAVEALSRYG